MKVLSALTGAPAKGFGYPGILDSSNPFLTEKRPSRGSERAFSYL